MSHVVVPRPCGDFRTSYAADATVFPSVWSRRCCVIGIALLALFPLVGTPYQLSMLIQIGYYGIAAIGLNVLIGLSGQISIGHAALFGFGAFSSAWLSTNTAIPVFFCIPLAGLMTMAIGLVIGLPAARIRGLYLAIATFAAQFILEDFFIRAEGFTGGAYGSSAETPAILGIDLNTDRSYFYLVLFWFLLMAVAAVNLRRTRDGRALMAIHSHYLSAEMTGVNLTKYRLLAFGISSFYAGVGGALFAHYLGYVSAESFTLLLSIQFLAMVVIGGMGHVKGAIMGTFFILLLPEALEAAVSAFGELEMLQGSGLFAALAYIKEMAIGLVIIVFLIFEPDGLAHRWSLIKAYWKYYPFSSMARHI